MLSSTKNEEERSVSWGMTPPMVKRQSFEGIFESAAPFEFAPPREEPKKRPLETEKSGSDTEMVVDDEEEGKEPVAAKRNKSAAPVVSATGLGTVVSRVGRWICAMQYGGQGLPRTRRALENAIAPMCRATVVVDARVVLFHLLVNGIVVEDSATSTFSANPAADLATLRARGFVACCCPEETAFSAEFVSAFWRAASWAVGNRGMPSSLAPLLRCMEQVCTTRRDFSPSAVADALCSREWVSFFEPDGASCSSSAVVTPAVAPFSGSSVVVYHSFQVPDEDQAPTAFSGIQVD